MYYPGCYDLSLAVRKKRAQDSHFRLSVDEVLATENQLFHLHHTEYFFKELKILRSSGQLSTSNSLCALSSYILALWELVEGAPTGWQPYQQKHPIILFRKSYLALILVRHLLILNHHAGPTMTMGIDSQWYYMAGSTNTSEDGHPYAGTNWPESPLNKWDNYSLHEYYLHRPSREQEQTLWGHSYSKRAIHESLYKWKATYYVFLFAFLLKRSI